MAKTLQTKFNSAYYLAKMERSFCDFCNISLLILQIKNKITCIKPKFQSCNQAALLTDYTGEEMKRLLAEREANARYFACLGYGTQSWGKRLFMFCFLSCSVSHYSLFCSSFLVIWFLVLALLWN